MKINPKTALGAILVLLAFSFVIFSLINTKEVQKSSLDLTSENNEFTLTFDVPKSNEAQLDTFFENLTGGKYPREDVTFKLDRESTLSLALKTPISASLLPTSKDLEFEGEIATSFSVQNIQLQEAQISNKAELVISAKDTSTLFFSRLNLDEKAKANLQTKIKTESGNYFVSFNSGQDFALYFNGDINLESQDFLPIEATNEASQSSVKIYEVKIDGDNELVPVIFEINDFKVLASSQLIAQEVLGNKKYLSLPKEHRTSDLSIYFDPQDGFDAKKFNGFLTQQGLNNLEFKDAFEALLSKVDKLTFSLKGTTFSGLINLK